MNQHTSSQRLPFKRYILIRLLIYFSRLMQSDGDSILSRNHIKFATFYNLIQMPTHFFQYFHKKPTEVILFAWNFRISLY